jgi:hypothetical protein
MQYRGIRYTVRKRIERDEWYVAIYPDGVELPGRVVVGRRSEAELEADHMIDNWLRTHPRKDLVSE